MKQYLHAAIAEDNTSGAEYFLASIVQDAVIHECFETEDKENLKKMGHRAARLALNSVNESMGINSFIVCETVRGVIHGLVALGGEPITMTREAIHGFCLESRKNGLPVYEIARGIAIGIKMTARDLGVDENEMLLIADSEVSASFWKESSEGSEGINHSTYHLEEEIESLINKTLSAHRKRPYIRYNHGKIRYEK